MDSLFISVYELNLYETFFDIVLFFSQIQNSENNYISNFDNNCVKQIKTDTSYESISGIIEWYYKIFEKCRRTPSAWVSLFDLDTAYNKN